MLGILTAVTVLGGGTAACTSSDSPHPPPITSIPPTTLPDSTILDAPVPSVPRPGRCPTAHNDRYQVTAGETLQVDVPGVTANDVYPCGGPVMVILVSGPSHGTLSGDLASGFEYTPDAGFVGKDRFTYEIQYIVTGTGVVDTDTATATITVRSATAPSHRIVGEL